MFHCSSRIKVKRKKYVIIGLMLQCKNHLPKLNITLFLRQVNLRLDGGKRIASMAKFQSLRGAFHHLILMDNCQDFLSRHIFALLSNEWFSNFLFSAGFPTNVGFLIFSLKFSTCILRSHDYKLVFRIFHILFCFVFIKKNWKNCFLISFLPSTDLGKMNFPSRAFVCIAEESNTCGKFQGKQ